MKITYRHTKKLFVCLYIGLANYNPAVCSALNHGSDDSNRASDEVEGEEAPIKSYIHKKKQGWRKEIHGEKNSIWKKAPTKEEHDEYVCVCVCFKFKKR